VALHDKKSDKINTREVLEAWLRGKPREVAQAIATRAALRVIPLVWNDSFKGRESKTGGKLLFSLFRAIFISFVSTNLNNVDKTKKAAQSAAYAVRSNASISEIRAAADAAVAAHAVAKAADAAAAHAYILDTAAAAIAAAAAASAAWESVEEDCRWIERDSKVANCMSQPLWLQAPSWLYKRWIILKNNKNLPAVNFSAWFEWYERLTALDGGESIDYFGPELSLYIALQPDIWWERGAEAVNADIVAWVKNPALVIPNWHPPPQQLAADISTAAENPPQQTAAPARFVIADDNIQATPLPDDGDRDAAQDFLDELRRKAQRLLDQIRLNNNPNPQVRDAVTDLLDALPPAAADLRPRIVLSRVAGVEACAGAFANTRGELELFEGAVAQVYDVAATSRLLLGCFPEVLEIEAAAAQLFINDTNAADIARHLDEIRAKAAESTVVGDSANAALNEQAEFTAKQRQQPEGYAGQAARYALTVRNFLTPVARFAVAAGFEATTEATGVGKEVWAKAKPKLIEGAADGLGSMGKPAVVAGVAALVGAVAGPVAGVAALVAGYGKIDQFMKLAEKYLLTKYGAAGVAPEQAASKRSGDDEH
jgi:hypothetical protein